ncbi:MAG: tetratricopeptide repeat-containing sensor histidine kinase [Mucilaginibacter sp.]
MKKPLLVFLLILTVVPIVVKGQAVFSASSQQKKQFDSLKTVISHSKPDTNKARALYQLAKIYWGFKPDTGIILCREAYILAQANSNKGQMSHCLSLLANLYVDLGDYGKAMQFYFKNLTLEKENKDQYGIIQTYNNIGSTYVQKGEFKKALQYLKLGQEKLKIYTDTAAKINKRYTNIESYLLENLGQVFLKTKKIDSAEQYFIRSSKLSQKIGNNELYGIYYNDFGEVETARGNKTAAIKNFKRAIEIIMPFDDLSNLDQSYLDMSKTYSKFGQPDSAIFYAKDALASAQKGRFLQDVLNASKLLYSLYDDQHNIPEAYKYYKIASLTNDSLFNQDKVRELLSIDFEEKQRQQEIAAQQQAYQDTLRTYLLVAIILFLVTLAIVFWRNNRQNKKAKVQIQQTLDELRVTQTQLIQSEKMASLGELTAGIAHEIQNPLNFVNNFSEVSIELLDEMEAELKLGQTDDAIDIAGDVKQNLEKIRHHGQRADGIVKGMLQHSRASSGKKEPTNINTLADEYLRLAYHGLRAKDKTFNSEMVTFFDEGLPLIDTIPQDIGRVLLNLFTNAFYAVHQKEKTAAAGYQPVVELTTGVKDGYIQIKVKDNGTGIPEHIKDKIMQPFFTTKPTGEGTGLGLSMSYDIVVKGHAGMIDVETKEGQYTEFTISLPLK